MKKKFNTLLSKMPKDSQKRIKQRVTNSVEDILLSEIRKLAGFTQRQLAEKMDISQAALSQLESKSDMQFSTLKKLIDSIGGELEVRVRFQGKELTIGQFS